MQGKFPITVTNTNGISHTYYRTILEAGTVHNYFQHQFAIIDQDFDGIEEILSVVGKPITKPGFDVTSLVGNQNADWITAVFTVKLSIKPTENVTIDISSSDTSKIIASPSSLIFTPINWDTPQTVTVTRQDSTDNIGSYTIILNASSSDLSYNNLNSKNVTVRMLGSVPSLSEWGIIISIFLITVFYYSKEKPKFN